MSEIHEGNEHWCWVGDQYFTWTLKAYDDVGEIWESETTILDIEGCDAL